MNASAAQGGRNRRPGNTYMQASPCPERPPRRRRHPPWLDPYKADLLERGNAGCRHALALCRARQSPGVPGKDRVVAAYVSRFRAAPRRVSTHRDAGGAATIGEADKPRTPRVATWLVRRREAKLSDDEKQQLATLPAPEGDRAEAIALTQDVAALGRQRQPAQLDTWRERAAARGLQSFKSGATGLGEEYAAVKAGVTLPWSTGPVDGQINRLKRLQRQRYGRANIALLRQRILLPTYAWRWGRKPGRLTNT